MKHYKLWIIVLLFLLVMGICSVKYTIPVNLEEKIQEIDIDSGEIVETELISSVKQDFLNFITISSDFIKTVFKGENSQFDSGYNVLLGKESINTEKAKEDVEDFVDSAKDKSKTILNVLSDKAEDIQTIRGDLASATLINVVDGDTIIVNIGDTEVKIRLIGIDTPESVHADKAQNNEFGIMASEYTKSLLAIGQTIYLEYDISTLDKYGRTLAYVWMNEDTTDLSNMLNYKILAEGYAIDKKYMPNDRYTEQLHEIAEYAKKNGIGLWKREDFIELWENN